MCYILKGKNNAFYVIINEIQITCVWTILVLCSRNFNTVLKILNLVLSCSACRSNMSHAMYVPVLPTPALLNKYRDITSCYNSI